MTRWLSMIPTLWFFRRVAVLVLVLAGRMASPIPGDPSWIGVPLGGGGARLERAAELRRDHPGATLVLAGSAAELDFATSFLRRFDTGEVVLLRVSPTSTWACVAALRDRPAEGGILITDGFHRERVQLSWSLQGPGPCPAVVTTRRRAPHSPLAERLKLVAYAAAYLAP